MSKGRFVTLSLLLDAVFVNVGIVAAFAIRFGGDLPSFNFDAYIALAPVLTFVYLITFYIYGLYEPERSVRAWGVAKAAAQAVTLSTILTAAISFFAGFFAFSRLVILIAASLHFLLIFGWRVAVLKITPIRWPEQRVIIVGRGQLAVDLAHEFQRRERWGCKVVGLVEDGGVHILDADELPLLGGLSNLPALVAEYDVGRIILASPAEVRELVEDLALSDEADVRIDVVPELYEIFIGRVDSVVSDIPLMELTRGPAPNWSVTLKRVIDIIFAGLLLVLFSPIILLGIIAILFTMGWPIFFTQKRVGKDMCTFRLIKLRTMVKDAEAKSGPVLTSSGDSRITPVGRFLRKYRVDELPQLWNILVGDMSFVGPRPERPFFVKRFVKEISGYRDRFKVKPGATGLAQVSGGYATTPERKLKYDLIYMYHQSLLMDIQILLQTVRVVLTGKGAR